MLFLTAILSIYFAAILLLIYGFSKVKNVDSIGLKPKTAFTILVPFRDEAKNLPLLLESISKMNYPVALFEVILIDDASKEKFETGSLKFKVMTIRNKRVSNSPKKDAITSAIPLVKTKWIITTDADCIVPEKWLLTLDNYIQTQDVTMIAGAVTYKGNNSFLHHFQQLDLSSLQGATIGSFGIGKGFMCNGANLVYTKSLFQELNGFEGNEKIASGDDVFLLQKAITKFPEKVHYLKSIHTIVSTKPLDHWKALFYQRVRWASKTTSYQSSFGKALGLIVFLGNISWIIMGSILLFSGTYKLLILTFLIVKMAIDSVLILQSNRFLTSQKTSYLLLSNLFYPFFSVVVALYSLFGKYEWKGRRF